MSVPRPAGWQSPRHLSRTCCGPGWTSSSPTARSSTARSGGFPGFGGRETGRHLRLLVDRRLVERAEVILSGFPLRWRSRISGAKRAVGDEHAYCLRPVAGWTFQELAGYTSRDPFTGSGLPRRIRTTAPPVGCRGTDVWSHPAGPEGWRLELLSGSADDQLLSVLTDPFCGLRLSITRHRCSCRHASMIDGCTTTFRSEDGSQETSSRDPRWLEEHDERQQAAACTAELNDVAFNPASPTA